MPGLKSGPISEAKWNDEESVLRGSGGAADSWSGVSNGSRTRMEIDPIHAMWGRVEVGPHL